MSPVFFTDRDLGKRFPEILSAAGLTVERHDALFPPDCRDEEWLAYVGESGRIAISHDSRIRYRPNELATVVRHSVGLLVVVGKAPLKELADNFVVTMPRIAAFLADHRTPFGRRVLASRCARACTCEGLPSDRQGDGRSATDRPEFGRYRPAFGQSASALDVRFQRRFRSAPFPR